MTDLTVKLNPIDPFDVAVVPVPDHWTLGQLLGDPQVPVRAFLNDREIPQDQWGTTVIGDDEGLIIVQFQDGNVFRAIGLIAVTALALWVPGGVFGLSGFYANLMTLGITVLGGLAINALIPPQVPDPPDFSSATTLGRYNALTGVRNQQTPYSVFPTLYGRRRFYPPIAANSYSETSTFTQSLIMAFAISDTPVEVNGVKCGFGGYGRLDVSSGDTTLGGALRIGDTNIEKYLDWELQIGAARDITLYASDIFEELVSVGFDQPTYGGEGNYVEENVSAVRTTQENTYKCSIDIVFPQGLWNVDDEGDVLYPNYVYPCLEWENVYTNPITGDTFEGKEVDFSAYIEEQNIADLYNQLTAESYTKGRVCVKRSDTPVITNASKKVTIQIEWKPVEQTEWRLFTTETITQVTRKPFSKTYVIDFLKEPTDGGLKDLFGNPYNTRTGLTNQSYDIRVTRVRTLFHKNIVEVSDMVWSVLRSYQTGKPFADSVEHTTILAMKIQATDQLSGPLDSVNLEVTSVLPVWTGTAWTEQATRNPAWAVLDTLRNPQRLEHPVPDAKLALSDFLDWAVWCDNHDIRYNFVHSNHATMFETVGQIATTGRASLSMRDGVTFTVVRDIVQTTPRQLISPLNSTNFRLTRNYIDMPHGLRVQYQDEQENYQTAEVKVYSTGYDEFTATKFEVLQTQGVTSNGQAQKEGAYFLKVAELRPETYSVDMDAEVLRVTRGDRVQLQNDAIQVGLGTALVESAWLEGAQQYIRLQSKWEGLDPSISYAIRVRKTDGSVVQGTISGGDFGDEYHTIVTTDATISGISADDLVVYGTVNTESIDCVITGIEFREDFDATVVMVPYDANIPNVDELTYPLFTPVITTTVDTAQAPPPTINPLASLVDFRADQKDVFVPSIIVFWELPVTKLKIDALEFRWSQDFKTDDENEECCPNSYDRMVTDLNSNPVSLREVVPDSELLVQARCRVESSGRWGEWSDPVYITPQSTSGHGIIGYARCIETTLLENLPTYSKIKGRWTRESAVRDDTKGTLSCWFLKDINSYHPTNQDLFAIRGDVTGASFDIIVSISLANDNQLRGYVVDHNGNTYYSGEAPFPTNGWPLEDPPRWHHAMLTFDTSQAVAADRLKFYLDGVEKGFDTYPPLNYTFGDAFDYLKTDAATGYHVNSTTAQSTARYQGLAECMAVSDLVLVPDDVTDYLPDGTPIPKQRLQDLLNTAEQGVWLRFQNKFRLGFDSFNYQQDGAAHRAIVQGFNYPGLSVYTLPNP